MRFLSWLAIHKMGSSEILLPPFSGVKFAISGTISIRQGNAQHVVARGNDLLIKSLEMKIYDNVWEIRFPDGFNQNQSLDFDITLPKISHLFILGSGNIISTATFDSDVVNLAIFGSGNMQLALKVNSALLEISGSGNMQLQGGVDQLSAVISGDGRLKAFGLACQNIQIRLSGSGDAEVAAFKNLRAKILGSGSVYYVGSPLLEISALGTGRVVDAN